MPAFSATTLSIPESPEDNFDEIIEHSRAGYARPRAEVEAEIRETIEQSEKYKKELSDSGRAAGEAGAPIFSFVPTGSVNGHDSAPVSTADVRGAKENFSGSSRGYTEQKPNTRYIPTPQSDFRKAGLSPNVAEGKERPGLKDLAKMVGQSEAKATENEKKSTGKNNKKGKRRPEKKGNTSSDNSPVSSPVTHRPEVIYQEKSSVKINPSEKRIDLQKPIKDPADYAEKDNSVDGFLSIKH